MTKELAEAFAAFGVGKTETPPPGGARTVSQPDPLSEMTFGDLRNVLKFRKLHPSAITPTRSFVSAAFDLYMCDFTESRRPNKIVLPPHATSRPIPTGIAIELPPGHVGLVCSRSGLASQGVFVANGPGIIDPDYRGEIKVLLYNGGHLAQHAVHGDRVAQLMIVPFLTPELVEVKELSKSERGTEGMGSTGR